MGKCIYDYIRFWEFMLDGDGFGSKIGRYTRFTNGDL